MEIILDNILSATCYWSLPSFPWENNSLDAFVLFIFIFHLYFISILDFYFDIKFPVVSFQRWICVFRPIKFTKLLTIVNSLVD